MEVCIAYMRGRPVMLAVRDNLVYLDGEIQPIKNIGEEDLKAFSAAVNAIPYSPTPGYRALVNARRTAFIASLLGHAVGDECVSRLTHILDSVHYDVLEYLHDDHGEGCDCHDHGHGHDHAHGHCRH